MERIVVAWPQLEQKVTILLDPERNRGLSELLLTHLPYRVVQNHALVSGRHLYHTCPIIELIHAKADFRVSDRTKEPDGTVFLSHLVHLGIKYGPLTEYLPAAPVGCVIDEDLETLRRVGAAMWEAAYASKRIVESHVYREGEPPRDVPYLRRSTRVSHPDVQMLIDEMTAAVNRIAVTPQEELVAIHDGRIESRAGSYNQYFTTLVFVNGEERPLGYNALGGLLSACRESSTSLEMLQDITYHFIKTPSVFLEYCGLKEQWAFVERVFEVLPLLTSKEEYHALIGPLYMYSGLLNCWNLHLFPWNADNGTFAYSAG